MKPVDTADPVVEARGLTKHYNANPVVAGIDLAVPKGSCFGLLGPNGAGKTTTLRMLLGLTPMDGGSLRVFGESMPECGRRVRQRTGVVPQADNLDPDFTVRENLHVYGRYFKLPSQVLASRITELLDLVELNDHAHKRVETLSGGMKRRLTFARALINDPDLVILDEPTTGLDPQVRHVIWARIRGLRRRGKTLLLTTHYMEEAERLCDELTIIDHGRVLAQGSPSDIVHRHVESEVLEIHDDGSSAEALFLPTSTARLERVGDTLFSYVDDATATLAKLRSDPTLTYLHRPTNLEDVFLKLTGRELRD